MNYKAFAFDIDGTLTVPNTHEYVPSAIKALRDLRALGKKVIISTGRPLHAVMEIKDYGIEPDYIACNNALVIADVNGNILQSMTIAREIYQPITEYCRAKGIGLTWTFEEGVFTYNTNQALIDFFKRAPGNGLVPNSNEDGLPFSGMMTCSEEEKDQLLKVFGDRVDCVRGERNIFDIIPKGYSKRIGLGNLLKSIDIKPEECMAFGDSDNDIEMLKFVGMGVAMGDALEGCRKSADYVTAPTYEDGILKALQHFGILE